MAILHLYDHTDNALRRAGYAEEYCEDYSYIRSQCEESIEGQMRAGVASLNDCLGWIRTKGKHHGQLAGITFHTHGNSGYIHLPNGGIASRNVDKFQDVCSRYLADNAVVKFLGCNVAEGEKGRQFMIAAGRAMLAHGGGWLYANDRKTFSIPFAGQKVLSWSTNVWLHVFPGGATQFHRD